MMRTASALPLLFALVFGAGPARAAGGNQVDKLKAFREGETFTAELSIKGGVAAPEVQAQFVGEAVQIDIPGVSLAKGKLLTRVEDKFVKSVYVYQPDESAVRARIFLKNGFVARSLENQVRVQKRADSLTIEIAGDARKGNAKNEPESSQVIAVVDADQVIDDGSALPTKLVADPNAPKAAPEAKAVEGAEGAVAAGTAAAAVDVAAQAAEQQKAAMNKLPENQIPVLTGAKSDKKEAGSAVTRLLVTLGVLTVLLGGACLGVKKWAGRTQGRNQNTKIRVLTQHHLGPRKNLAIIQVAGETLLIGVTDQNISMLKTLALIDDEIPEETPRNFNRAMADFDEDDDEIDSSSRAGKGRGRPREKEDFAMRGLAEIRDVVSSRLKNFKNLE